MNQEHIVMTNCKSKWSYGTFPNLLAGAFVTLCLTGVAGAQSFGTISAGTSITVRTHQDINTRSSDGSVLSGVVEQDVFNGGGSVAIPRGAEVELLVKNIAKNEIALDLESITVGQERYAIQSEDVINSQQSAGFGANQRTGEFLGGGALIGAIVGAVTGGGKGA